MGLLAVSLPQVVTIKIPDIAKCRDGGRGDKNHPWTEFCLSKRPRKSLPIVSGVRKTSIFEVREPFQRVQNFEQLRTEILKEVEIRLERAPVLTH